MRIFLLLLGLLFFENIYGQRIFQKLLITPLYKDFFVYTTYGSIGDGNLIPANGMYLVTQKGIALLDTPWDTTQFQPLLDSLWNRHHLKVVMVISTHSHDDRTAGLNYYKSIGIKTYTTQLTDKISQKSNEPRAEFLIMQDTIFKLGEYSFQTYYPGQGHSPDNILIWFPKEKILYGGCFIKSIETESPGNLSDANIDEWIKSIKKVQKRFKNPQYIIPGHQAWSSKESLNHTLVILKNYKRP